MSKEAALAFLKKVAEDSDLQSKLVAFAAEQGYEFTADELGEAELEAAAGGSISQYMKIDDIEGESQLRSHDKWIDILSIDTSIPKPGS